MELLLVFAFFVKLVVCRQRWREQNTLHGQLRYSKGKILSERFSFHCKTQIVLITSETIWVSYPWPNMTCSYIVCSWKLWTDPVLFCMVGPQLMILESLNVFSGECACSASFLCNFLYPLTKNNVIPGCSDTAYEVCSIKMCIL